MAEDQEPSGPSLEPPSLFRRRKKKAEPPPPPPEPAAAEVDESPTTVPAPIRRAQREGPVLPPYAAAAVAGLLVGALVVALTSASFGLCDRVRGTNSCGGPGLLLLVAILVLAVVLGSAVLRLLHVQEPGSTSFLAVGLTSVVALLFLIDQLFDWWMVIAIPLVSVATFLLSHWVTATFVDTERPADLADEPEPVDHDVR